MLRRVGTLCFYTPKHIETCHRLFSTKTSKDKNLFDIKVPKKRSLTIKEKDVYKFFASPEKKVAHNFPESFFVKKRGKTPDNFYLAHKEAANIISKVMTNELPKDKLIMEVNPGIGLLTQKLIDETDNDLFLYEANEEMFDKLAVCSIS